MTAVARSQPIGVRVDVVLFESLEVGARATHRYVFGSARIFRIEVAMTWSLQ